MNNTPRLKLIEIIAQYGRIVIDEPHKVEGLLRDFCGEYKREIHSLMDASRERIPLDLRAASGATPPVVLISNLTKRLLDNRPMTEDMARWAVESWAIALGVIAVPVSTPLAQVQQVNRPVMQTSGQPQGLGTSRLAFEPQMVRIAAGEFWMGSTTQQVAHAVKEVLPEIWVEAEQPQHKVILAEYAIGKYPITCHEYQAFVQDSGHSSPSGWNGREYPAGNGDHPVVNVSWNDAQAYCVWLSQKTGKPYCLPSEAEWEKAAGGTDGRLYPWGNLFEAGRANTYEEKLNDITPVGQFSPLGDSPYGCADMIGNVWEWTRSLYRPYPYDPQDGREDPQSRALRTLRGGAFCDDLRRAGCACRNYFAFPHSYRIGFRVALVSSVFISVL